MFQSQSFFIFSPDGQKGGSDIPANNNDRKKENFSTSDPIEEDKEKPFSKKVHDALQEWSNDDQRDQEFDDTRP